MALMRRTRLDIGGYSPALPTPFDASNNIDRVAFERLCAQQIAAGSPALVVASLTGEAPTLSPTEARVLTHIAVDVARGRVPVLVSAGSNSTSQAIDLTRDAERLGANGVISVVPYYNKPSQAGLIAHFNAIRRSTGLPIILHDAPARCAIGLSDATVAELAASDQFIGLKDDSGDLTRAPRLRGVVGPEFLLLSGHDPTAFAFQALGGDGCISAICNLVPAACRDLSAALRNGDLDHAQQLAGPINRLANALALEADPVAIKCALYLMGLIEPTVRLPLVELDRSARADVLELLLHFQSTHPQMRLARDYGVVEDGNGRSNGRTLAASAVYADGPRQPPGQVSVSR